MRISLPTWRTPLTEAIIAAGAKMGWPVKEDVNAPDDGEGVGYMPRTIWKGKRQSAAVAFLNPARARSNLTVITGAVTDHILFDGKRAVGVEILRGGQHEQIGVRREVLDLRVALHTEESDLRALHDLELVAGADAG